VGQLERYLAKEILLPFLAALIFLTQLLLMTQILARADILLGAGVTALDIAGVAITLLPHLIGFVMPIAFLLGAIVGVGRLAEDRELMAIGAAGLSPVRLVRVPLAIGVVLAAVGVWFSTTVEPAGLREARLRFNEIIKRNLTANVRAGTFFEEIPGYTVFAARVGAEGWGDVLISDRSDPASPVLALAKHGRLEPVGSEEEMRLVLEQGEVHREDPGGEEYVRATFRAAGLTLGVGTALSDRNALSGSTKELTQGELAVLSVPGEERSPDEARGYQAAYHRRLAAPLAVLAFALMAVPLAAMRRGGRAAAIGASIVAVVAQYVLLRTGEVMAQRGTLPAALSLQLSNLVLALVGLALCGVLARRGSGAVR
jgi:lipopolysaccharide export system permease protein